MTILYCVLLFLSRSCGLGGIGYNAGTIFYNLINMKLNRFIIGFLVGVMVFAFGSFGVAAVTQYTKSFSDVTTDDWFYTAVMELSEKGMINGYEDGTFGSKNPINRAEVSKLVYLLDQRISILENKALQENGNGDEETVVVEEEEEEEVIDEGETSEVTNQLVLNVTVDLEANKLLPDGYAIFEELSSQNFMAYVPDTLFWNNTYGALEDDDEYLWYVAFGDEDFDGMDDAAISANEKIGLGVVSPDDVTSEREVLIFVERDDTTSFLIEGDIADLRVLQKIAVSLTNVEPTTE